MDEQQEKSLNSFFKESKYLTGLGRVEAEEVEWQE